MRPVTTTGIVLEVVTVPPGSVVTAHCVIVLPRSLVLEVTCTLPSPGAPLGWMGASGDPANVA